MDRYLWFNHTTISFKVSFDSPNKHIAVNLLLSTINYNHSQPSTHQSINQSSLSTSAQQSANGSTLYKNSNNNSYCAFQTYIHIISFEKIAYSNTLFLLIQYFVCLFLSATKNTQQKDSPATIPKRQRCDAPNHDNLTNKPSLSLCRPVDMIDGSRRKY